MGETLISLTPSHQNIILHLCGKGKPISIQQMHEIPYR